MGHIGFTPQFKNIFKVEGKTNSEITKLLKEAKLIEKAGGKIGTTVSSKTNYLLAGEKPGSKLRKAKEIGISIINERELIELIQTINV